VEAGWARARRTILISDVVNVLAAVVLYVLAVGGVRGFAFTLGLTTLVDVLIVFLFTKPLVTLLARSRFFAAGSRWSGFDAEHLNRGPAYVGRGRLRSGAPATASGQEPGTGEESGTADGSRAATSAESSPQPSTEPSSEPSSEPSTQQRTEDEELVPAGAPAPRRGGRGGGTPADGADAIGFGPRGATPPRRTGSSIAERRAAAERAAREAREASPTDGSAASGANGKDL
jgi:preprotein translocase subunit SecD